jgi:diguanylate cyclase (GGDEF)-like protein
MASEHAGRYKERLAILMLDLDDFKNVNDSFGHDAGDRVLQEVAQRLGKAVRKVDTVSRFGGDEFIILLTEIADENVIDTIAGRIVENMLPGYVLDGNELKVTFSIGISVYPADSDNLRTLMRDADLAMYQAKRLGHNRFEYFSSGMD